MTAELLAIDIGNTAVKLGWFTRLAQVRRGTLPEPLDTQDITLRDGLPEWPTEGPLAGPLPAIPWFVTSVNRPATEVCQRWVDLGCATSWRLLDYRDVPLKVRVDEPARVGLDRLATAVAADWLRDPQRPAIVVDAGTALKVHVVTAAGEFSGGAILPGFRLASEALHIQTDLLPQIPVTTNDAPPAVVGRNTAAAIRSGIYWGAVGAVRELIGRIRRELPAEPQVFITGGDARGLASLIDHDTRFVPHLCLAGIALIARHVQPSANSAP
ncbi:MAG: type III pantothenate kinase [Pirellulales bacterium]